MDQLKVREETMSEDIVANIENLLGGIDLGENLGSEDEVDGCCLTSEDSGNCSPSDGHSPPPKEADAASPPDATDRDNDIKADNNIPGAGDDELGLLKMSSSHGVHAAGESSSATTTCDDDLSNNSPNDPTKEKDDLAPFPNASTSIANNDDDMNSTSLYSVTMNKTSSQQQADAIDKPNNKAVNNNSENSSFEEIDFKTLEQEDDEEDEELLNALTRPDPLAEDALCDIWVGTPAKPGRASVSSAVSPSSLCSFGSSQPGGNSGWNFETKPASSRFTDLPPLQFAPEQKTALTSPTSPDGGSGKRSSAGSLSPQQRSWNTGGEALGFNSLDSGLGGTGSLQDLMLPSPSSETKSFIRPGSGSMSPMGYSGGKNIQSPMDNYVSGEKNKLFDLEPLLAKSNSPPSQDNLMMSNLVQLTMLSGAGNNNLEQSQEKQTLADSIKYGCASLLPKSAQAAAMPDAAATERRPVYMAQSSVESNDTLVANLSALAKLNEMQQSNQNPFLHQMPSAGCAHSFNNAPAPNELAAAMAMAAASFDGRSNMQIPQRPQGRYNEPQFQQQQFRGQYTQHQNYPYRGGRGGPRPHDYGMDANHAMYGTSFGGPQQLPPQRQYPRTYDRYPAIPSPPPMGVSPAMSGGSGPDFGAPQSGMSGLGDNHMHIRAKFGQLGGEPGFFNSPHGFCLGYREEIIVADTQNHRIQVSLKSNFGTCPFSQFQFPNMIFFIDYANFVRSSHSLTEQLYLKPR